MNQAAKHAKEEHGMDVIPAEVVEKCQKAIRDLWSSRLNEKRTPRGPLIDG